MKLLRDVPGTPEVSIIWLDWSVRESFHSLDYLARQTVPRDRYELIWVEYYDSVPGALERKVAEHEQAGRIALDQWLVLEAPRDVVLNKHFCYNAGIALARGKICVICDSDVIFPPDFIERVIGAFRDDPRIALHIDEIRNANPRFYPFNYPAVSEILADPMTINWTGTTTQGLAGSADMLHEANYGACMAARREDLIAIGGSDEHVDYLGYICGPYELTFRLVNRGHRELWLNDVFLIHTWHPGEGGANNAGGPHDGRGFSSRALEIKHMIRSEPAVENEAIRLLRTKPHASRAEVVERVARIDLTKWHRDAIRLETVQPPALAQENIYGHNIILYKDVYYAFPQAEGAFLPQKADAGEYDRLPHGPALAPVVDEIGKRNRPGPLAATLQRLLSLWKQRESAVGARRTDPVLVRENVASHNIILYDGMYYALPQASGKFRPRYVHNGKYRNVPQSAQLDDLMRRLEA